MTSDDSVLGLRSAPSRLQGGILAGHPGTVKGMEAFLDFLPHHLRYEWGVVCYGGSLLPLVGAALERGGHIAIGLGDYHYREMETPTNAQLISRVVRMARDMGRQIATPEETRQALGLGQNAQGATPSAHVCEQTS